jgi:hypothetical protein
MSDVPNGAGNHGRHFGCDDDETVIYYDGPGDNTIRPCPPELLASARAEREKLIRYGGLKVTPKLEATTPNGTKPETKNGVLRLQFDDALLQRLYGLKCPIELLDATGKLVARVTPVAPESETGSATSTPVQ